MEKEIGTKERLLQAALRLLDEGGPAAVTLRAVGSAGGVSHNAPYKHFKDKHALLVAIARVSFQHMGEAFAELTGPERSPLAALHAVVDGYVAFSEAYPQRYNLLFTDPDIGAEGGSLETAATATYDVVAMLIGRAQRAGEIREGDPYELTGVLYAAIHGLVNLNMTGRSSPNKGMHDIRRLCALQLDLLRAPGDRSRSSWSDDCVPKQDVRIGR